MTLTKRSQGAGLEISSRSISLLMHYAKIFVFSVKSSGCEEENRQNPFQKSDDKGRNLFSTTDIFFETVLEAAAHYFARSFQGPTAAYLFRKRGFNFQLPRVYIADMVSTSACCLFVSPMWFSTSNCFSFFSPLSFKQSVENSDKHQSNCYASGKSCSV